MRSINQIEKWRQRVQRKLSILHRKFPRKPILQYTYLSIKSNNSIVKFGVVTKLSATSKGKLILPIALTIEWVTFKLLQPSAYLNDESVSYLKTTFVHPNYCYW